MLNRTASINSRLTGLDKEENEGNRERILAGLRAEAEGVKPLAAMLGVSYPQPKEWEVIKYGPITEIYWQGYFEYEEYRWRYDGNTGGSRMVTYKYDAVMEGRNGAYVDTAKTLSIRVGSVFSQANAKYNSDPALAEQRQKALELSREINKLRKEQAVLQDQLVAQYENDRSDQGGYAVQDYNTKQDFWQELLGRRNKNQTPTGVMTLASANTTSGNETDTDTGWMGNVNDIRNLFAGPGAPVGVGGGTSPLQKSTDENGWTDPNHHSQVEKDQAAEKLNKKQQEIKDAAKDTVVSGVAEFVPAPGEVGGVIKKVVVEVAKDKAKGGDGNPIDAGKKVIENSMDDVNKVFEGIKELWGMGIDKMRKLKERNKTCLLYTSDAADE